MHRLLSYKGYVFPEVRREDAAVLNPSDVCHKSLDFGVFFSENVQFSREAN